MPYPLFFYQTLKEQRTQKNRACSAARSACNRWKRGERTQRLRPQEEGRVAAGPLQAVVKSRTHETSATAATTDGGGAAEERDGQARERRSEVNPNPRTRALDTMLGENEAQSIPGDNAQTCT
jgi:hypothetical protein